jgi:hypothetical protein
MSGGAYESDLLNLWEQAMRDRSLANNQLFRMPTLLPKIDESALPRERADVDRVIDLHLGKDRGEQEARAGKAINMYPVSRRARQHSSRFSVVALLARLWRPF